MDRVERVAGHHRPHVERPRRSSHPILHRVAPYLLAAIGVVSFGTLATWANAEWNRHSSEADVSSFAAQMREKLQAPSKFLPGERFYSRVTVIAAGRDWPGLSEMIQDATPVNIRNYTEVGVVNDPKGKVIGKIAQGSEIFNVIFTPATQPLSPEAGKWGIFECPNAKGAVGEPGENLAEPGRICAIYGVYLDPAGQ